MATVASLRNVGLAYESAGRRTAVFRGLDFTIGQGEFVAVVGASGVGKSTLLRTIAGLAKPSEGEVELSARTEAGTRPFGLVFQESRLLPWRRVLGNVELGLEGLGLPRATRRERATAALRLVGLADYAARWPYQLSGGQRQRVGLARAFAVDPALLLMDEPFGALDAITREALQDELLALKRRTGKTILFVTHDIDEAVYLADRVVVMAGSPASIRRVIEVEAGERQRGSSILRRQSETIRDDFADHSFAI